MIAVCDTANAGKEFLEWVSHLQGNIFVILQIYADESGTHHPKGDQPNSEVPVIAGYMAFRDEWKKFCPAWKAVLDRYDVQIFHAKDYHRRAVPYNAWDDVKYEHFKYALAEVAGRQVPIGGAFHIKENYKRNPNDAVYPYQYVIHNFFTDLHDALIERGYEAEKVSIIFDENSGKKWNSAIHDEIQVLRKDGIKIGEHTYGTDSALLPLQAADMSAHRSRELHFIQLEAQARSNASVRIQPNVFDVMLNRNLRPKSGFQPVITKELTKEVAELSQKYSQVRRALMEIPNDYFGLKCKTKKKR